MITAQNAIFIFYLFMIIKTVNDKAKPSVRVGRKATGLKVVMEPKSGYHPSWLGF